MSLTRITLLMALLAGCGSGASAEQLLPHYLRQSLAPTAVSLTGTAFDLGASSGDAEPVNYLAEATAAAPGRAGALAGATVPSGRWALALAPDAADGQVAMRALVEALNALGPIGVSMADYLALTLAGPDISSAGSGNPPRVDAVKAPGTSLPPSLTVQAPLSRPTPAPTASAEQAGLWALSSAMSERLTRYLVGAAALAILVGAGLRLVMQARRNATPSLARF